jgi:hypothetical protein
LHSTGNVKTTTTFLSDLSPSWLPHFGWLSHLVCAEH